MVTAENQDLYFQEKLLDSSCIPDSALRNQEQVTGLAASFDIAPGVLLAEGMFESLDDILKGMREPVVAGFKAEDLPRPVPPALPRIPCIYVSCPRHGVRPLLPDTDPPLGLSIIVLTCLFHLTGRPGPPISEINTSAGTGRVRP